MSSGEHAVADLNDRLENLARRFDMKEIRDEAQFQALQTLVQTEVAAMQKDAGVIEAAMKEMKAQLDGKITSLGEDITELGDDVKNNYVPLTRYGPLEKIFWGVILATLLGLLGGALAILTGQSGGGVGS